MLYLSRMISPTEYGVVDTDDYVEEKVSHAELQYLVLDLGLEIHGVISDVIGGEETIEIGSFYQDPRFASGKLAKLKTMYGVDIRVYDDEISWIGLSTDGIPDGAKVRLSDYAKKFSWCTPICWNSRFIVKKEPFNVIFVFDDKLKVYESFRNFDNLGTVGCDFSEFHDDEVVEEAYNYLIEKRFVNLFDYFIDNPDREAFWDSVANIQEPARDDKTWVLDLKRNPKYKSISKRVGEMYFDDFKALSQVNVEVAFYSEISREEFLSGFCEEISYGVAKFVGCKDFEVLRKEFIGILYIIKLQTTIKISRLTRFENYIRFFDVSEEIKQLYVQLCNKAAKFLVEHYQLEE